LILKKCFLPERSKRRKARIGKRFNQEEERASAEIAKTL
jgi:hypothetical protein